MKCVILILIMATTVNAFEQIYAVNCGGKESLITDSDGISYQPHIPRGFEWGWQDYMDMGEVPESNRPIYEQIDESYNFTSSLKYDIPLLNDGLYLLITKFSTGREQKFATQSMTLNNEIQLHSNVDLFTLCGGSRKICDEYFYFCVTGQTLYYQNASTVIRNEKISIEIRPGKLRATIAGIVLLKGQFGERQKLVASAKKEQMFFETMKMNPMCSITATVLYEIQKFQEEQRQSTKELQTSVEINSANQQTIENHELAVKRLEQLQTENSNELQMTLNRLNENSLRNISNLKTGIQTSFEGVRAASDTILHEIQGFKNKSFEIAEQQVSKKNIWVTIQKSWDGHTFLGLGFCLKNIYHTLDYV
jgi:Malectin domain